MKVLSLTFHATESVIRDWEHYQNSELLQLVENLFEVEKYLISEVESEMVSEGRNTNLFLVFENGEKLEEFVEFELKNIAERVEARFGENVMLFQTLLHPLQHKW